MGKCKPGILGKRHRGGEEAGSTHSAGKNAVKQPRKGAQQRIERQKDIHQIPTWRLASPLHQQCAVIVGRLLQAQQSKSKGATVKGLCLAAHVQNKAAVYAVVCETLKYLPTLRKILQQTDFSSTHAEVSEAATLVMLYDLLVGQGVRSQGRAERAFLSSKEDFELLSQRLLEEANVTTLAELLPQSDASKSEAARPRTVRVNTLKCTVKKAVAQLAKPPLAWPAKHRNKPITASLDAHLPDLLLLPPGTDVHDHPLVLSGALVQQGKASCMPAHALRAEPGWHVVDCCAAPGNKTSHAAARVGFKGRVAAFEKDPKRGELLTATLERAGATNVTVTVTDFFKVDPADERFKDVRGVILDPSCSGSGTAISRMDHLLPADAAPPPERAAPGGDPAAEADSAAAVAPAAANAARGNADASAEPSDPPAKAGKAKPAKRSKTHAGAAAAAVAATANADAAADPAASAPADSTPPSTSVPDGAPAKAAATDADVADAPAAGEAGAGEGGAQTAQDGEHAAAVAAAMPGVTSDTAPRVLALASFQKKILRHALQFPALTRLVYSTCSVYRQENEDVVAEVLPYAEELGFSLGRALPEWPRRGLPLPQYPWADRLVRVHPQLDQTDGFFVAVFEK